MEHVGLTSENRLLPEKQENKIRKDRKKLLEKGYPKGGLKEFHPIFRKLQKIHHGV